MLANITDFTSASQAPRKPRCRIPPHFILRLPVGFMAEASSSSVTGTRPSAAALQCLQRTRRSSSDTIRRRYGLKVTACTCSWTDVDQRHQETDTPPPLLKNLEQTVRSTNRVLRMPTALTITKPPLWPDPWTRLPSFCVRNRLAPCFMEQANKGNLFLLGLTCCRKGPNKALSEFLVWLLVNFY